MLMFMRFFVALTVMSPGLEILDHSRLQRMQGIFEVVAELCFQVLQPFFDLRTQAVALLRWSAISEQATS